MKKVPLFALASGALFAAGAFAAAPELSVSRDAHPDMADAQRLTHQAWTELQSSGLRKDAAAAADLNKAQDLLVQVNDLIRKAVDSAKAAKKERKEEKREERQEKKEAKKEEKAKKMEEKKEERRKKMEQQ